MKFSCEKETLLNLLNIASRAVTGKSSMPLLEGLLLAADADTLTITGYDLSMGIRTTAQVDVVEPGRIVLNRRHDSHCPSDRRRVSQLPCGHSEGVRARGFGGSPGADPVHRTCLPDRVGKAEKPDPLPF